MLFDLVTPGQFSTEITVVRPYTRVQPTLLSAIAWVNCVTTFVKEQFCLFDRFLNRRFVANYVQQKWLEVGFRKRPFVDLFRTTFPEIRGKRHKRIIFSGI